MLPLPSIGDVRPWRLEGHGIGLGLGMHVRLVAGDTHVFEVQ